MHSGQSFSSLRLRDALSRHPDKDQNDVNKCGDKGNSLADKNDIVS